MITASYKKYMKSQRWQKKRQEVFAHYGKRCYVCRTARGPIQVHHLTYIHFGNERLYELRPLCVPCHRKVGRLHWKMGKRKSGFLVFQKYVELYRAGKTR